MSGFFNDQYLKQFNSFITELKQLFINNCIDDNYDDTEIDVSSELKLIEELDDNDKINKGKQFNNLLSDDLFDLFLKSKIKVYSHKNENTLKLSECLFGKKLTLRNLLNNQSDEIKKIIWINLHTLYSVSEFLKPFDLQNSERISLLHKEISNKKSEIDDKQEYQSEKIVFNKQDTKNKLQEMLGVDVNNQTSDMIDDIVGSFENVLSGGNNSNPLLGIMDISQKISSKYADQINKGDIELDKIMDSIMGKIPGMNQIMSSLFKKPNTQQKKVIIDGSFTTANIDVGKLENDNTNMKFGNMLKMADNFGIIPGGKNNDNSQSEMWTGLTGNSDSTKSIENPGEIFTGLLDNIMSPKSNIDNNDKPTDSLLGGMFNGLMNGIKSQNNKSPDLPCFDQIGKMMNIIKKLENSKSKDDMNNIKSEMDNFLGNDLGIDITKLNEDIKKFC